MVCNFDAGDCCNGTEQCNQFPVEASWFDDGYCDGVLNNEVWGYDGKDCCACNQVDAGIPCLPEVDDYYCEENCGCKRGKGAGSITPILNLPVPEPYLPNLPILVG